MTDQPRIAIIGTRGYPSYYGGFETAVRMLARKLPYCHVAAITPSVAAA